MALVRFELVKRFSYSPHGKRLMLRRLSALSLVTTLALLSGCGPDPLEESFHTEVERALLAVQQQDALTLGGMVLPEADSSARVEQVRKQRNYFESLSDSEARATLEDAQDAGVRRTRGGAQVIAVARRVLDVRSDSTSTVFPNDAELYKAVLGQWLLGHLTPKDTAQTPGEGLWTVLEAKVEGKDRGRAVLRDERGDQRVLLWELVGGVWRIRLSESAS